MSELSERIQDVISNEPVAVFIKGTAAGPDVRQLASRACTRCARRARP